MNTLARHEAKPSGNGAVVLVQLARQEPDFSHGESICHIVSRGNTPVKPAVYLPKRALRPSPAEAPREVLFL